MSPGEVVSTVAVVVSALGVLIAWMTNRRDRQKEYANRIRQSAGLVTARLDRWTQLSSGSFDDVQIAITEADVELVSSQNVIHVRDLFWQRLGMVRSETQRSIRDEQIEVAHGELLGYSTHIHDLFVAATGRLRAIDDITHSATLELTQEDVLAMGDVGPPYRSAQLGNALRDTCGSIRRAYDVQVGLIAAAFRAEMFRLIDASDASIARKEITIRAPHQVLPATPTLTLRDEVRRRRGSSNVDDSLFRETALPATAGGDFGACGSPVISQLSQRATMRAVVVGDSPFRCRSYDDSYYQTSWSRWWFGRKSRARRSVEPGRGPVGEMDGNSDE